MGIMQSEKKLAEANYFLGKLRITPQDATHENESKYTLSAFLNAWRSIIDIILYDYSEKFGLCVSRDEKFLARDFEIAARATNTVLALTFVQWCS